MNVLVDERFKEERNLTYISKWLKNSIKYFNSFDESLVGLQNFFESAQVFQSGHSLYFSAKHELHSQGLYSLIFGTKVLSYTFAKTVG